MGTLLLQQICFAPNFSSCSHFLMAKPLKSSHLVNMARFSWPFGVVLFWLYSLLMLLTMFVCSYINERNRKRNIVEAEKAAAVCSSLFLRSKSAGGRRTFFRLRVWVVRAQNNGRSNVRPDWRFDRSNIRLAGHVDRTHLLVTFIVIFLNDYK